MSDAKFRWGIMGCAGIVKRAVARGIQESQEGELFAIASREPAKAEEWAREYGIAVAYGGYEALLEDPRVDGVYLPLPNHLHREWTLRAAAAGKHVLCEKPIALDAAEAAEMLAACRQAGVHLAEAFMYRHHPRYGQVKALVAGGELGEIRGMRGAFTYNGAHKPENVRFHREMGGGSVYDIGCYPISAARFVLGREPEAVTARAFFSPRHDGVDMMAAGLIEFPGDVSLLFDCGMWAAHRNTLEILGTEGFLEIPSAFNSLPDATSNFFVTREGRRREIETPRVNQYAAQADDFVRFARAEAAPLVPAADPLRNMRVIDACLASARTNARITLPSSTP
jgi:predicted dehydrogenase